MLDKDILRWLFWGIFNWWFLVYFDEDMEDEEFKIGGNVRIVNFCWWAKFATLWRQSGGILSWQNDDVRSWGLVERCFSRGDGELVSKNIR